MVKALKENIAEFSAFKETSFKHQVEALLTENGRVVSWEEFKHKAQALNVQYNQRWLKTEYDQTVATAHSAQQFEQYVEDQDVYPNLKYVAVNDGRTREQHRAWDGLVLPVTHTFWQTHLPPNDWGCRCTVEQTAEPVTEGVNLQSYNIKSEFTNNPAVTGKIFKESAYEKALSDVEKVAVQQLVKQRLKKEETWEIVPTESGKVRISSLQSKIERKENIEIASYFANKYNHEIDLLGVIGGVKTPDALNKTLDVTQEYKRISTATKNAIDNALRSAKKQADNIVLDIKTSVSESDLRSVLRSRIFRSETIKTITILKDNQDITYTREDILKW